MVDQLFPELKAFRYSFFSLTPPCRQLKFISNPARVQHLLLIAVEFAAAAQQLGFFSRYSTAKRNFGSLTSVDCDCVANRALASPHSAAQTSVADSTLLVHPRISTARPSRCNVNIVTYGKTPVFRVKSLRKCTCAHCASMTLSPHHYVINGKWVTPFFQANSRSNFLEI